MSVEVCGCHAEGGVQLWVDGAGFGHIGGSDEGGEEGSEEEDGGGEHDGGSVIV